MAEDAALIWGWANDPTTRANSFDTSRIPWRDHLDWLERKLCSPNTRIWILEWRSNPIGIIRYDRDAEAVATLSFSVARGFRGRGLGVLLLRATTPLACRELGLKRIEAVALKKNVASIRAFQKAGFSETASRPSRAGECAAFVQSCPPASAEAQVHAPIP